MSLGVLNVKSLAHGSVPESVALCAGSAVSAGEGLVRETLVAGVGRSELSDHDWLGLGEEYLLLLDYGGLNLLLDYGLGVGFMNHWLLELLMNYRPLELLLNDFLMFFVDDGLGDVVDDFFVGLVDDWLVDFSYLLLVDDGLVMLVDDILMLLVDYILMMLVHHVLMMLVDDVLVVLFDDGLADVGLHLHRQNVLLDLSGHCVSLEHRLLIMANDRGHLLVSALDFGSSLGSRGVNVALHNPRLIADEGLLGCDSGLCERDANVLLLSMIEVMMIEHLFLSHHGGPTTYVTRAHAVAQSLRGGSGSQLLSKVLSAHGRLISNVGRSASNARGQFLSS